MWLQLLKLHGDFTRLGEPELVAGHVQYRRVMLREARHALPMPTLIIALGCRRFGVEIGRILPRWYRLAMIRAVVSTGGTVRFDSGARNCFVSTGA